jgi:hypothetical protein
MTKATYDQATAIHTLLSEASREQLQVMLTTGLLADLRDGNLENVDRDEFRRVLGLKPRHTAAIPHVIDVGKRPFCPEGWTVVLPGGEGGWRDAEDGDFPPCVHRLFTWDASKVQPHLDDAQRNGGSIEGHKLQKKLAKIAKRLLNANCLDYLLAHPELIPESWKGKATFFWGTTYRSSSGRLCVRCLCWDGERWYWNYGWLGSGRSGDYPAAVLRECEL